MNRLINGSALCAYLRPIIHNYKEHKENFLKTMSIEAFRSEFGTIELALPRRSGKTYAIDRLANEFENSLIVVSSTYNIPNYNYKRVVSIGQIPKMEVPFDKPDIFGDYIFVDEFTYIPKEQLDNLREQVCDEPMFIMLGTKR